MKSFEHYKRVMIRSAERGLIDHEVGPENRSDIVGRLTSLSTTNEDRLIAAFQLAKELLPKNKYTESFIKKFAFDPNKLPFNLDTFEFKGRVGEGSICEVYLLESKDNNVPSYAIKIQKNKKLENNAGQVAQKAKDSSNEYQYIQNMYKDVPGLVPEEFTLVIENPRNYIFKNEPRVALVQKFYG